MKNKRRIKKEFIKIENPITGYEFSEVLYITKENLAKLPKPKAGLYKIIDDDGVVVHVAKSVDGNLAEDIYKRRSKFFKRPQFQYCVLRGEQEADLNRIARQEELLLRNDKLNHYVEENYNTDEEWENYKYRTVVYRV